MSAVTRSLSALVAVWCLVLPAFAADLEAAADWLVARSGPDGVHAETDIASAIETNVEAWRTLELVGRADDVAGLEARVAEDDNGSIEAIADRLDIRVIAGRSPGSLPEMLSAAQRPDGSFPSHPGFEGDPVTTAVSIVALDRLDGNGTAVAGGISALLARQLDNGAWPAVVNGEASPAATAVVLERLQSFANRFELTTPIEAARSFLISSRQGDGSHGPAFATARVIAAGLAAGIERGALQPAVEWLAAQQLANGSFGDDAFVTALALRALTLWARPVEDPARAGLELRVVAADTRLPIAGATLVLDGAQAATLVSNDDGVVFSTSLMPGEYSAAVEFPGMQTVAFDVTLFASQLSALGEVRMVQADASDSALGTVRGRVSERDTGEPIVGAVVESRPDSLQATTGVDGTFQILQVEPGSIELRIAAPDFSTRTTTAMLEPGGTLELSAVLTRLTAPLATARVDGQVTSGLDGTPLADVEVAIRDAATDAVVSAASTGPAGGHSQEVDFAGEARIVASAAGLDPAAVTVRLSAGEVFDFSPALYPEGESPPGANATRIVGTVVNQADRAPVGNALVAVDDPGGQQTVRSDDQGRFVIDGLAGPDTRLRFTADAFEAAELLVPVLPLATREIGPVALQPSTLEFYFPDLVITDSTLARTDPDTFALRDSIAVEVTNRGTSNLEQDFDVIAFIDADGDGAFDAEAEPVAGRARVTEDLPIGSSSAVPIAVSGTLNFRDAPVALAVDPDNEVPEQDEDNNVSSTTIGCRAVPAFIGDDGIAEEWRWQGLASNPDINSVTQVPVVGQLTDDNGDGVIDAFDIPDLVFVAGRKASIAPTQTALVAISGSDGAEIWSRTDIRLSHFSSPALGDLDNDGVAEIVVVRGYREEILAFEHDGTLKWRTSIDQPTVPEVPLPPPPHVYDMPVIVNLEGDNEAEVILGRQAFRGTTGERLWEGAFDGGGVDGGIPVLDAFSQASVVADIDLDGLVEIVAGRTVYDVDGNTIWFRDDIKPEFFQDADGTDQSRAGYTAIGNFDLDDFAEIVLAVSGELYLLEHTGETIWGPVRSPDGSGFGPPTVIDLDGDGLPEIVVPSNFRLTVFETDGTVKWTADIQDQSGVTGATVFDFEDDGLFEIAHHDETDFRIFDALTGAQLFETRHTSPTVLEYPVVADVDGDRQAEIVLAGFEENNQAGVTPGIRVFAARDGAWADAGSVWGSHAFHIDEVDEDSTIPLLETPSWLTHNTYRVQRSPRPDPLGRPDFTLGDLRLLDQGPGRDPLIQVRVGNAGPVGAHEPPRLGLFAGDPEAGGTLLREVRLDTLRAGRFQLVSLGEISAAARSTLHAVVDHPDLAGECREDNNRRSTRVSAVNGDGDLQLSSDRAAYELDDTARFTVRVSNVGGVAADYSVALNLRDANGGPVTGLPSVGFEALQAGSSTTAERTWPALDVLGGVYTLAGELINGAGDVVDSASVSFTVGGDAGGPAGAIDVQLEQAEFAPGRVVEARLLARNVSDDTTIRAPRIRVDVTGPAGVVDRATLLPEDLLPGQRFRTRFVADDSQPAGEYTIRARLESALDGQMLAEGSTAFTRLSMPARALEGRVQALGATLLPGQLQTCVFTLRNPGGADRDGLDARRRVVRVADGQPLFERIDSADLPAGGEQVSYAELDTTGFVAGDYLCTLEIGPAPDWQPLDAAAFAVAALPEAAVEVEPTALETAEDGTAADFTLRLIRPPSATVRIPLEVSDATEWRLSRESASWTQAAWESPITVRVTGVDDDVADGDRAGEIRVLPAESADAAYAGLDAPDVALLNRDDDGPGVVVDPTALTTNETGTTATFAISINAAPSEPVAVELTNPDPGEWSIEPQRVVFSADDWVRPREVVVTGRDDDRLDGPQTGTIAVTIGADADPAFADLDPADVALTNEDDERAAVAVTPTQVTTVEGGPGERFNVALNAAPAEPVAISIGFVDAGEWQVEATEIVIDGDNWQEGVDVVVTPVDDAVVDGPQTAVLLVEPARSADARFDGLDPADVTLVNQDDEQPRIIVEPVSGLIVSEDGRTDSFTVALAQTPSAPVTVALSSADPGEFAVSHDRLAFAPSNATDPVTVTITGVDDSAADGNVLGTIQLAPAESDDVFFAGIDPSDVLVTNLDDEQVAILVEPEDLIETDETGRQAFISVWLNHAPTAAVRIDVAASDPGEWEVEPTEVVFGPDDWQGGRRVVVTGVDDAAVDGPVTGQIRLTPAVSDDARYQGIDPPDVPAVNRDDDTADAPDQAPTPVPVLDRIAMLMLTIALLLATLRHSRRSGKPGDTTRQNPG
jgi:hypothetical protein